METIQKLTHAFCIMLVALYVSCGNNASSDSATSSQSSYQESVSNQTEELSGTYTDFANYVDVTPYENNGCLCFRVTNISNQRISSVVIDVEYESYGPGPRVGQGMPDWYWREETESIRGLYPNETDDITFFWRGKEIRQWNINQIVVKY